MTPSFCCPDSLHGVAVFRERCSRTFFEFGATFGGDPGATEGLVHYSLAAQKPASICVDVRLLVTRVSPREAIPPLDFLPGAQSFLRQSSTAVELQPPHRRGGSHSKDEDIPHIAFEVCGHPVAVSECFIFPKSGLW
jgi:hypothetical protein